MADDIVLRKNFGDAASGLPSEGEAGIKEIVTSMQESINNLAASLIAVKDAADQGAQNALNDVVVNSIVFED